MMNGSHAVCIHVGGEGDALLCWRVHDFGYDGSL